MEFNIKILNHQINMIKPTWLKNPRYDYIHVMFLIRDSYGDLYWAGLPFLYDTNNIEQELKRYIEELRNSRRTDDIFYIEACDNITKLNENYRKWYFETYPDDVIEIN